MLSEFEIYKAELIRWNQRFNLTSITDPQEIQIKHFEDSLSVLKVIELKDQSVVDIGCGAGFPGIPLKIACPQIKLTLVDSVKKKINFLNHIVKILALKDVRVILSRAEDLPFKFRETYDVAVARAVKKLRILCEYCLPYVKVGGIFVSLKSEKVETEVDLAMKAINLLGGKLKEIKKIKVSDMTRSLVLIEKIKETPRKYPRRAGIPAKRPL